MDQYLGGKKFVVYFAIIFFLTLITIFLIFEFRFLKRIINENDENIRQIIANETYAYMNEMRFYSENSARYFSESNGVTGVNTKSLLKSVAGGDQRILEVYWLDKDGHILDSLSGVKGSYPFADFKKSIQGRPFIYGVTKGGQEGVLAISALIADRENTRGYLVINYDINYIKNKFLFKYSSDDLKVSLFNAQGSPIIWPFGSDKLAGWEPGRDSFKDGGISYQIISLPLDYSGIEIYFFSKYNHFDTYRIVTIMFLLFALYFLIYQFIVEVLNVNNINSYFDNIDFNIFNNLKEGIIIANKFNRIVFANHVVFDIFTEKTIVFNKTELKEIIGPLNGLDTKLTLKKSNNLLEIICSPIFKNGKMLGSLVVMSLSLEKEKLCGNALGKVMGLLPDGVVFVDKDNKIVAFNMMASYYLGNMENEMNINEVSSELGTLIDSNMGSTSITRAALSFGQVLCDLVPINDDNSFYAGMVVFLRDSGEN